jgi:hypothetical protein
LGKFWSIWRRFVLSFDKIKGQAQRRLVCLTTSREMQVHFSCWLVQGSRPPCSFQ